MNQRAAGTLVGLACGDALGRPIEFLEPEQIVRDYGQITDLLPDQAGNYGAVTDDTEQTKILAESLLKDGRIQPAKIRLRLVDWMQSGTKDIGYLTETVLRTPTDSQDWITASYTGYKQAPEGLNAGNGSLMRTAPIGLCYNDSNSIVRASRVISAVTHFDSRCQWSCAVLNQIINKYVQGQEPDLDAIVNEIRPRAPNELVQILSGVGECEPTASGYVFDTLETSLHDALNASGFKSGLVNAVNRGHDADTIGAVTGALLGARFGLEGIPRDWRNQVEYVETLSETSQDLLELSPPSIDVPDRLNQR